MGLSSGLLKSNVPVGSLFEQLHAILEFTNLLCLQVFIHALAFQPACPSALPCSTALHRGLAEGANDKVVEFCKNRCGECVNLKLNFLLALSD